MDLNNQVQNEGLCLIRLCEGLADFIELGLYRKTYLYETNTFLTFIKEIIKEVHSSVCTTVEQTISPQLVKSRLREYDQMRRILNWLYFLTKEAIDSDTLCIPHTLTIYLNHLAAKLETQQKISLVVLGSSDLMYYKYNLKYLRDLTNIINAIIPTFPKLSIELGILKFPYCASREILNNCNLFHEMGHYFYELRNLQSQFHVDIENSLDDLLQREKKLIQTSPNPLLERRQLLIYACKLIYNWANEIYSDIFAIRVLGPAFHLAFLEIEQMLPTNIDRNRKFSATHPADYYRFKMHAKWLFKDNWGDIIKERTPFFYNQLERCQSLKIKNKDFSINSVSPLNANTGSESILHEWMLTEFEKVIVKVEDDVSSFLSNQAKPLDDFVLYDELVTKYLEHGIVPSTVYNKDNVECHPSPTTLLNSGFFFYLDGMKELLKKVKNSKSNINNKVAYNKRLNEWLSKGIEDWQIINARK